MTSAEFEQMKADTDQFVKEEFVQKIDADELQEETETVTEAEAETVAKNGDDLPF